MDKNYMFFILEVDEVRSFKQGMHLDKYTNHIDLE